jgi:diguanylate cyclase (GGDEF)-like protein/PAS domain S-box-containing protein
MLQEDSVGLCLARTVERDIVHAAALICGLSSIDLLSGTSAPSASAMPSIIVTDQPTGPWSARDGSSFSLYDSPTLLRVSDPDPSGLHPASLTLTPAFALERPLRLETATALLKQAASMTRSFALRHLSMIDDLAHCRRIFDSVSNGITISDAHDPDLPLTYVNPAFERMTGYTSAEVCGRNCRFLQGTDRNQTAVPQIRRALTEGTDARVVLRNYRKDGTLFWNEFYLSTIRDHTGRITHFVGIQNDVTRQVEATNQLEHLAHHDALTGLANRALLMAQLSQSIDRARRIQGTVAVLFFDLNKFKEVNDTFGHDAGDQLLLVVAARLRSVTRGSETVARLGGDEFVVVLDEISADRQLATVMHRLTEKLGEPTHILGAKLHPSASIGLAIFPEDGDTAEALLKSADSKMYLAKQDAASQRQSQPPPIAPARDLVLYASH